MVARTLLFVILCLPLRAQQTKIELSARPLDEERLSIYRDFFRDLGNRRLGLSNRNHSASYRAYLANITISFQPDDSFSIPCFRALKLVEAHTRVVHEFGTADFPPEIHVVDLRKYDHAVPHGAMPTGRWFEDAVQGFTPHVDGFDMLSEIVFDESHTHAVFNYLFASGPESNHGFTVVYSRIHGKWKLTKNHCGEWVS